jgi:hypothetical protein
MLRALRAASMGSMAIVASAMSRELGPGEAGGSHFVLKGRETPPLVGARCAFRSARSMPSLQSRSLSHRHASDGDRQIGTQSPGQKIRTRGEAGSSRSCTDSSRHNIRIDDGIENRIDRDSDRRNTRTDSGIDGGIDTRGYRDSDRRNTRNDSGIGDLADRRRHASGASPPAQLDCRLWSLSSQFRLPVPPRPTTPKSLQSRWQPSPGSRLEP